jgi:hypothetical protein
VPGSSTPWRRSQWWSFDVAARSHELPGPRQALVLGQQIGARHAVGVGEHQPRRPGLGDRAVDHAPLAEAAVRLVQMANRKRRTLPVLAHGFGDGCALAVLGHPHGGRPAALQAIAEQGVVQRGRVVVRRDDDVDVHARQSDSRQRLPMCRLRKAR